MLDMLSGGFLSMTPSVMEGLGALQHANSALIKYRTYSSFAKDPQPGEEEGVERYGRAAASLGIAGIFDSGAAPAAAAGSVGGGLSGPSMAQTIMTVQRMGLPIRPGFGMN